MGNAGVIDGDIAFVKLIYFTCYGEFSATFNHIDDLAEIVDLGRAIKEVLVHDLAGKEQLRIFDEAEVIAFTMRDFDFWHGLVPPESSILFLL